MPLLGLMQLNFTKIFGTRKLSYHICMILSLAVLTRHITGL